MPYYTFADKETGEEITMEMKISELDTFKEEHPNLEQMLRAMALADPLRVGIGAKPKIEFRELLKEMKRKVPHNNINSF